MKWPLLLIVVWALTSPATAEDTLTELSRRVAAVEALEGDFVQEKSIAVLPQPLISRGEFRYRRGAGLTWHTEEPVDATVHIDASGNLKIDNGASPPQGTTMAEEMGELFLGIFSGHFDRLRDYFTLAVSGTADEWRLIMSPASEGIAGVVRQVVVSGGDTVARIELTEANGDATIIRLEARTLPRDSN